MEGRFVPVYSTGSVPEGLLARARLEAEGIPVLAKGEGDGPYRMGPVHLFVPEGLEVQARLVLETAGDVADAMDDGDDPTGSDPEGQTD